MYEKVSQELVPRKVFFGRVLRSLLLAFMLLIIALIIGMSGYHFLANLSWTDSFLNAAMILGGMGPVDILSDKSAKIFAGCYALFSGVMFLSGIAIFFAPILHRFLHKMHIETGNGE